MNQQQIAASLSQSLQIQDIAFEMLSESDKKLLGTEAGKKNKGLSKRLRQALAKAMEQVETKRAAKREQDKHLFAQNE
jgi:hypothetical protein